MSKKVPYKEIARLLEIAARFIEFILDLFDKDDQE